MKKLLVLSVSFLLCAGAFAQTSAPKSISQEFNTVTIANQVEQNQDVTLLDKIQAETEQILIAHVAPFIKLADLVKQKLEGTKKTKAAPKKHYCGGTTYCEM